ncbi:mucin-like glycoprotein [Trypanosoma conorhini]|uniref:Mucin-like glycoprotein n=1 Tax=Trypanosoma conorhini TaxID=83891 RepID=A0A422MQ94_9TRYP|nr:mucin-like glycoprotein [Trypanosoma conorhini]RNE95379.1 mucin-like glycoprotein [Trypanosoma conorhini]
MTQPVRRRAVCALALLALLCGCCCASVSGATKAPAVGALANVSVQVACANDNNKLRWRFPGETAWKECAAAVEAHGYVVDGAGTEVFEVVHVDVTLVGGDDGVSESLCLSAESQYAAANCSVSCNEANAQGAGGACRCVHDGISDARE